MFLRGREGQREIDQKGETSLPPATPLSPSPSLPLRNTPCFGEHGLHLRASPNKGNIVCPIHNPQQPKGGPNGEAYDPE